jgi:hypothetical protein
LHQDIVLFEIVDQLRLLEPRMSFDLVHRRWDFGSVGSRPFCQHEMSSKVKARTIGIEQILLSLPSTHPFKIFSTKSFRKLLNPMLLTLPFSTIRSMAFQVSLRSIESSCK